MSVTDCRHNNYLKVSYRSAYPTRGRYSLPPSPSPVGIASDASLQPVCHVFTFDDHDPRSADRAMNEAQDCIAYLRAQEHGPTICVYRPGVFDLDFVGNFAEAGTEAVTEGRAA